MGLLKFLKFLRLKLRRRRAAERVAAVDFNGDEDACGRRRVIYSWEEIQKFSMKLSLVIGYGGFSTVYLAKLPDSSTAAVKIQFRCGQRLDEAYRNELEILLQINHPNIIKLLGYCGDDREEGALILEHVANGNLHENLHSSKSKPSSSLLSWRRRMAIAFQLADAIDHLHQNCIVHCDIKASNILLDEQLNCKLCDFGSSKMGFTSLVVPSKSMMGSPGYTDPYYMRTGLASKKSDVYSYGVVLLELISGMEALDPLSGERLTRRAVVVEKVAEIVDPQLREYDLDEAKAMAAVAALCLSDSPSHRPSLSDIMTTMRKKVSSIAYLF